jgi:hypothetical protein
VTTYRCCPHCADDQPHVEEDSHTLPCDLCARTAITQQVSREHRVGQQVETHVVTLGPPMEFSTEPIEDEFPEWLAYRQWRQAKIDGVVVDGLLEKANQRVVVNPWTDERVPRLEYLAKMALIRRDPGMVWSEYHRRYVPVIVALSTGETAPPLDDDPRLLAWLEANPVTMTTYATPREHPQTTMLREGLEADRAHREEAKAIYRDFVENVVDPAIEDLTQRIYRSRGLGYYPTPYNTSVDKDGVQHPRPEEIRGTQQYLVIEDETDRGKDTP